MATPPRTAQDWIAQAETRLRALENPKTQRFNNWVLSERDGEPILTGPDGQQLAAGQKITAADITDLTRGYVTADDVNAAVTGADTAATGPLQDAANFVGNLIDNITNGSIPDAVAAGEGRLVDAFNSLQALLGIGNNAQGTADDAWSAIVAMKAILGGIAFGTGTSGSDNFDGAATTDLSANYTELFWGAALNHYKLNGSGRAVFNAAGFSGNNCINLWNNDVFIGNAQTTGVYLPSRIAAGTALVLITNFDWSDTKEAAIAYITDTTVQAGYITFNGSGFDLHTLGAANSYAQADGEFWQFDYGDVTPGPTPAVTNPNMYRVRRNNDEVLSYDDSSSPHITLDANHVDIAWGGVSASGFFSVAPAPTVDSFAFWERA